MKGGGKLRHLKMCMSGNKPNPKTGKRKKDLILGGRRKISNRVPGTQKVCFLGEKKGKCTRWGGIYLSKRKVCPAGGKRGVLVVNPRAGSSVNGRWD